MVQATSENHALLLDTQSGGGGQVVLFIRLLRGPGEDRTVVSSCPAILIKTSNNSRLYPDYWHARFTS